MGDVNQQQNPPPYIAPEALQWLQTEFRAQIEQDLQQGFQANLNPLQLQVAELANANTTSQQQVAQLCGDERARHQCRWSRRPASADATSCVHDH